MGDELHANGITNDIRVWRRGVDIELFHPSKSSLEMRQKMMPTSKEILLVCVSRLSKEKSLEFLAPVIRDSRLRTRCHLTFVGDGPIREQLEKETFADLTDCVSFMGFLTGEPLAMAYASSDLFVFPSSTETLGLVAIEATASGIPVIGMKARGLTVTVKDGETGLLFEIGNVEQCIQHILSLIDHPERRMQLSKKCQKGRRTMGMGQSN